MKTKVKKKDIELNNQWRNPLEVVSCWPSCGEVRKEMLQSKVSGKWWSVLNELGMRLIVSREYEHLLMALGSNNKKPEVSYSQIPHPSGIAVDHKRKLVYVASTRNPNQVFTFSPAKGIIARGDIKKSIANKLLKSDTLLPIKTMFYPGSLYIHDIEIIQDRLYANAVGHNAIVELLPLGGYRYSWWPKCIEKKGNPDFSVNYLQLNSIAGGKSIRDSFFCASADKMGARRPGQVNFPVDQRGVVFSGKTREPICYGLTRPHSTRLCNQRLWVDNSGYGELGFIENKRFNSVVKLPGWTRGLFIKRDIAFVGVSKVIPRFYKYAPGLNVKKSVCGVFAVDLKKGKVLGSIQWPSGNQIFSVAGIPSDWTKGFSSKDRQRDNKEMNKNLFYSYNK